MSIESLIAATSKRGSAKKKESNSKPRKKRSPDLLAPIGKWVDYFHDMNSEQMNVLQLRIERLYQVSWSVLKTRREYGNQ